jgi:thiol-disulfide isomerase/thioredoxin/Flp pilus assembly protein TadD
MRSVIGLLVAAALVLPALPAAAGDLRWHEQPSFDDVLEKARSQEKHVIIDFFTVWCGPCKMMDKQTYSDPEVVAFMNGVIPVKYDSEEGVGIDVSKKFRVNSWPTTVLLGPDGEEIGRHIGYLGAEDFLRKMRDFQNGIGTIAYHEEKLATNPDDPATWKTLGGMYGDIREADKATRALNRYLELSPDASDDEVAEVRYTIGEVNYSSGAFAQAVSAFEEFIRRYPETDYHDSAMTLLARSYYKTGDTEKCIATYMTYVDRNPDDPRAMNSFAWFCASRKVGLDEALPVALKMVELAEREAGYLDTLAELYYARGEYDLAIEIGTEAAEREPGDKYFTDQLEKFKKAKAEAAESS